MKVEESGGVDVKYNVRDVVNRVIWDPSLNPEEFRVVYADRFKGAVKEFSVSDVERVEGFLIKLKGGRVIPLHRVKKVYNVRTGEVLLSR